MPKKGRKPDVTLVIPVYRQEATIRRNLTQVLDFVRNLPYAFEVIAVIDGELDGSRKTAEAVRDPQLRVIGYQTNKGKGYAVRYGFAHSRGDIVGFLDAGMDIDVRGLGIALEQMRFTGADAVIGSKRHPDSKVTYPLYRRFISFGYQLIIRLLFGLSVRDTQVGMKIYSRKLLEDVLPRLLVKKFAFDIEILAVAYRLGYRKITECPVILNFKPGISSISRINFWRIVFQTLKDTIAVWYRLKVRRYYDDGSVRKWRFDPELNFRVNVG